MLVVNGVQDNSCALQQPQKVALASSHQGRKPHLRFLRTPCRSMFSWFSLALNSGFTEFVQFMTFSRSCVSFLCSGPSLSRHCSVFPLLTPACHREYVADADSAEEIWKAEQGGYVTGRIQFELEASIFVFCLAW